MSFRNLLQKTKRKIIKENDEMEKQWGKKRTNYESDEDGINDGT